MAAPVVAVVNHSTVVSDADVHHWALAINRQVRDDFCPAWGLAPIHVEFRSRPSATAWLVAVLDDSDQAGALGYHDLSPTGLPIGKVFAKTDQTYKASPSVTLSHEVLELIGDPWIDQAAQGPDGWYAYEAGDPVEADELGYEIDGVLVSDFVLPAWWGTGFGKVDHLGHLSKPFTLAAGGYCSVWTPGRGWTQRTAAEPAPQQLAPVGSRRERRARGRDSWLTSSYEES